MKILYCVLWGKSGGDIYFRLLQNTQSKLGVIVDFKSFHRYWSLYPQILRPFIKIDSSYDIIHSNSEYAFAFNNNIQPLIVSVQLINLNPLQSNYLTFRQKLYYKLMLKYVHFSVQKAHTVITVSRYLERILRELFNVTNVQTIYNGVDIETFKPIQIVADPYPGKIKLLYVGNLIRRKGVDLLPKIMENLDNRFLLMYTTGIRSPRTIFSDKRMIPIGSLTQKQLVYWYNLCDICIFPTRQEGFGYTAAEAMACGKSVVTTNCSSLPEIVINGENGFLCKMDDVSDFVAKIMTLADNQTMRQEMGVRNRKRIVDDFNLEKMGREYNELYRRVIKEFNEQRG